MKYDMRTPCDKCPFVVGVNFYLTPGRAQEIADALRRGGEFPCHKTIDYDAEEEGRRADKNAVHCAGALLVTERDSGPNQMHRIAERLGVYDASKLDREADVYDDLDAFIEANVERESRLRGRKVEKPKPTPMPRPTRESIEKRIEDAFGVKVSKPGRRKKRPKS